MTANSTAPPPIDIPEALDRAMGEKDFLAMLLDEFCDGLPGQIEQLRVAIANQDQAALSKQSHTLKGAAGSLSAKAMAAILLHLEQVGQGGDFEASRKLVDELEGEALRLQQYLARTDWLRVN